jgi:hypothetical protein
LTFACLVVINGPDTFFGNRVGILGDNFCDDWDNFCRCGFLGHVFSCRIIVAWMISLASGRMSGTLHAFHGFRFESFLASIRWLLAGIIFEICIEKIAKIIIE